MRIVMPGPFGFTPKKTMRARAFGLATELVKRGHQVRLVMPPWHTPESADQTFTQDGVEVRYVRLNGGIPLIVQRMVQDIVTWQPDVVHAFKPKAYSGLTAEWLWRRHQRTLPLVVDMDDWEGWGGWNELEPYPTVYKHFFARQEQWGMRHCHALTVASRALETLAWGNGVPPAHVHYLPNGPGIVTDMMALSPSADSNRPPTLLVYSRFFEFDVARLVNVIAATVEKVPDLHILLVGASLHSADGERFQQLMQSADLWRRVENVGWLEEAALPAVLTRADVGIYLIDDSLLNRTKCPVKLADLCALGIPTVAEKVGQTAEYVRHGQSGFLHESGDVAGVAASLIRLLQSAELRAQISADAIAHMQQFRWDKAAAAAEAIYASL